MAHGPTLASERGQGTVEWAGLVLLVAVALAGLVAIGGLALPGAALARSLAAKLACAIELSDSCGFDNSGPLRLAYGDELAGEVAEHAPTILYESGMKALPVDYRRCREDACADGAGEGRVWRSETGEPVVAFVRVIDCRPGSATATPPGEADCSSDGAGHVYLQYWLYYPGSATGEGSIAPGLVRRVTGGATHHPDDWESFTIRLGPGGTAQRASAHRGYGRGWVPAHGALFVSGGSHAGTVEPHDFDRMTPPGRLRLIPLEPIAAAGPDARFAVTPPWLKRVWRDPEYTGTD